MAWGIGVPVPKGEPRIVAKTLKRRAVARMDRIEKEKVRQRDGESCRVCGRRTREVHERLFRSLGGVPSLENSMCACRRCHEFLQGHGIKAYGQTCSDPLRFVMSQAVARLIFGHRSLPPQVEISG